MAWHCIGLFDRLRPDRPCWSGFVQIAPVGHSLRSLFPMVTILEFSFSRCWRNTKSILYDWTFQLSQVNPPLLANDDIFAPKVILGNMISLYQMATIRFSAGIRTDLAIEPFKGKGGLTLDRCFTEYIRILWVCNMHKYLPPPPAPLPPPPSPPRLHLPLPLPLPPAPSLHHNPLLPIHLNLHRHLHLHL